MREERRENGRGMTEDIKKHNVEKIDLVGKPIGNKIVLYIGFKLN